jgi:hypothetical protein
LSELVVEGHVVGKVVSVLRMGDAAFVRAVRHPTDARLDGVETSFSGSHETP